MSEIDPSTFPFQFCSLNAAINQLSSIKFATPKEHTEHLSKLIYELRQFDQIIDQSELFSPNEVIDDVQTESLKYLLIPFMLGKLILDSGTGYDGRLEQLKEAKIVFKKYIDRCDLLLLVDNQQHKLLIGRTLTPLETRERKINEFKREKILMPKFLYLQQMWTREALKTAKLDQKSEYITPSQSELPIDNDIEENERDIMLQVIDRCIDHVITYFNLIKQESDILEFHAQQKANEIEKLKHSTSSTASGMSKMSYNNTKQGADSMYTIPENEDGTVVAQQTNSGIAEVGPASADNSSRGRVFVSKNGISSGGLRVHEIKNSEDTKKPIPQHMKDFMVKPNPVVAENMISTDSLPPHLKAQMAQPQSQQQQSIGGSVASRQQQQQQQPRKNHEESCPMHPHQVAMRQKGVNVQDVMTDEERLSKPWFNPKSGDACSCTSYEDVTLFPDYVMSARTRGGRGKLIKVCQVHKVGIDVCGCNEAKDISQRDRIEEFVDMRTDRSRTFRDRNPYLMELDDWAKMKIDSGELPCLKDRQLAERIKEEEERHRIRVENGESDDDEILYAQGAIDRQHDEEQMEARQWDDWKDDNQKGAGNTKKR